MAKMLFAVVISLCSYMSLGYVNSEETFSGANPIRKIVGMLQDMQKELEREQENEAALFDKAMCACEEGAKELSTAVADTSASIESLTAKVKEETSEKESLSQELSEHYSSKDAATSDLAKATSLREKEARSFAKGEADKKSNIKALGGAVFKLEGGASSASLMQTEDSPKLRRLIEISKYIQPDARRKVLAFLDQGLGDAVDEPSAPVAEIVGYLKSMEDTMMSDYNTMKKDEVQAFNDFNTLKAAKQQEIGAASESIITKEKRSGAVALSLSQNKHALDDATKENTNAKTSLENLNDQCATKKNTRAMRNKLRTEEIAAISDAIRILNNDESLEVFKKAVPSAAFTQQKKTYDAFMQFSKHPPRLVRARNLIAGLVKKHSSSQMNLLLLALEEKSKEDPGGSTSEFASGAAKVVDQMIDGMVHVLHDEDVADEHKKDWCANETETTDALHHEKTSLSQQLIAELEEMGDSLASTEEEIKTMTEMIAENDKNIHEATEQRKKEHQEFVDAFTTLDSAKRLMDKAMIRLRKFYSPQAHHKAVVETKAAALEKAGLSLIKKTPTAAVQRMIASFGDESFIQKTSLVLPETPGTYEKMESGGIIGLMQQMKLELSSDMTEAETEEKNSAKDYVRAMKDAQESRAEDVKSLNHKKEVKATTEMKITDAKELHSLTEKEIHNLDLYMAQMHTECDFLIRNFEVRHEGRVGEEVGLEEAKTIVTGEEPPNYKVVEAGYESEHSDADVEEHFVDGSHIHPE